MKIFASVPILALGGASAFFLYGSYKLGQFDSALMTMHELIAADRASLAAKAKQLKKRVASPGIPAGGSRFAHASYAPQLANPANFRDNNGLSYPSRKD